MAQRQKRHQSPNSNMAVLKTGFEADECVILHIARYYCFSYMKGSGRYWEDAIDRAVSAFGEKQGAVVAVSVLNVLRNMRASRKTVFNFQNPYCAACSAKLTRSERSLIRTLQCVRNGDKTGATVEAMILCEGNDSEPMMQAIRRLAELMRAGD